ncbi:hypothetical protein [Mucilaginibacter rivuli]|nr:hypothetical protein [Mucilaginibacter rivuli]
MSDQIKPNRSRNSSRPFSVMATLSLAMTWWRNTCFFNYLINKLK